MYSTSFESSDISRKRKQSFFVVEFFLVHIHTCHHVILSYVRLQRISFLEEVMNMSGNTIPSKISKSFSACPTCTKLLKSSQMIVKFLRQGRLFGNLSNYLDT